MDRAVGRNLGYAISVSEAALFSEDGQNVTLRFGYHAHPLVAAIIKKSGIPLHGFQMSRSRFADIGVDLNRGKALFFEDAITWSASAVPGLTVSAMENALRLLGTPGTEQLALLPLITSNSFIGVLGIWGTGINREDLPNLSVFAGAVAGLIQNSRLYTLEQESNRGLTRSTTVISALATVASAVSEGQTSDEVIRILKNQMGKLEFKILLAGLSEDKTYAAIDPSSVLPEAMKMLKERTGIEFNGISLPKERWSLLERDYFSQRKSLFVPDLYEFANMLLPMIPVKVLKQIFKSTVGHVDDKAVFIPLFAEEDLWGVLGIWGRNLQEDDIPALTVFAAQVSTTLKNARQLEDERFRSAEISNSLHEKEILLKEVHHRVKNNLQIISSLLNLQAETITNPEVLSKFSESRDRFNPWLWYTRSCTGPSISIRPCPPGL